VEYESRKCRKPVCFWCDNVTFVRLYTKYRCTKLHNFSLLCHSAGWKVYYWEEIHNTQEYSNLSPSAILPSVVLTGTWGSK
jgi:hypothetical protein